MESSKKNGIFQKNLEVPLYYGSFRISKNLQPENYLYFVVLPPDNFNNNIRLVFSVFYLRNNSILPTNKYLALLINQEKKLI